MATNLIERCGQIGREAKNSLAQAANASDKSAGSEEDRGLLATFRKRARERFKTLPRPRTRFMK